MGSRTQNSSLQIHTLSRERDKVGLLIQTNDETMRHTVQMQALNELLDNLDGVC